MAAQETIDLEAQDAKVVEPRREPATTWDCVVDAITSLLVVFFSGVVGFLMATTVLTLLNLALAIAVHLGNLGLEKIGVALLIDPARATHA